MFFIKEFRFKLGKFLISNSSSQDLGTIFNAIPPLIFPTLIVENGGSKLLSRYSFF